MELGLDAIRVREYALRRNSSFSRHISREIRWIIETQTQIVKSLCTEQAEYLRTGAIESLKPLTRSDVAQEFGYSSGTISRLIQNLFIIPGRERLVEVACLLPGTRGVQAARINAALDELKAADGFFSCGHWWLTSDELAPIVRSRAGLKISARHIRRFLRMRSEERFRRDNFETEVKNAVKRLLQTDDPKPPLTDQAISLCLSSEDIRLSPGQVAGLRRKLGFKPVGLR